MTQYSLHTHQFFYIYAYLYIPFISTSSLPFLYQKIIYLFLKKYPVMRRTTSMTGITVDSTNNGGGKPSDDLDLANNGLYGHDQQHVSSKYHHRSSSDQSFHDHIEEMAHFLTICGRCNRRLPPSRDIYMYRGDTAFCSMECREQQMKKDERKEKSKLLVLQKKTENHHNYSKLPSSNSENSGKSKTIAAA